MSDNEENKTVSINDIRKGLESTTEQVQSSFDSIYSTLLRSLENNVQMTQAMNNMVVHMYQTNVRIETKLEPAGNGSIHLTLHVQNKTQFPVLSLKGSIQFESDKIDLEYHTASIMNDSCHNLFEQSIHLPSQSHYTQSIEIKPKDLIQCNGLISLSFPSPGNNELVHINHRLGIYLIDQLVKDLVTSSIVSTTHRVHRRYTIAFIRHILSIPPIHGIYPRMIISLHLNNYTIEAEIMELCEQSVYAQVDFMSEDEALLMKLLHELDVLSTS
ncbi:hypothetical protein BDB01DRAFT_801156 [Pilobolus umbonatus]|nr:hypothetical protein BDB01DRAFT_801156 [Pilobolus umbonatus]